VPVVVAVEGKGVMRAVNLSGAVAIGMHRLVSVSIQFNSIPLHSCACVPSRSVVLSSVCMRRTLSRPGQAWFLGFVAYSVNRSFSAMYWLFSFGVVLFYLYVSTQVPTKVGCMGGAAELGKRPYVIVGRYKRVGWVDRNGPYYS